MSCVGENTLAALADGDLSDAERRAAEAHLDACAACRDLFAALARFGSGTPVSAPSSVASLERATALGSTPAQSAPAATGEPATAFAAGDRVAGRYRIVRFLARGGMGEVYEAEDLELGERVALKTLAARLATDEPALARFRGEIQMARRVTHANVCRIFDLGVHEPAGGRRVAFLTMELLDGETLRSRLRRAGRLSVDEALPLVRQLAAALDAAHAADVVHCDFKSDNVFLVRGKTGERVVVTDFGLARDMATALPGEWRTAGTPAYMSPEQVRGEPASAAADLYALGVVLYEMVTGALPFRGRTPAEVAAQRLTIPPPAPQTLVPSLPARWQGAILRCLDRDPSRRFGSAAALVEALAVEPASWGVRLVAWGAVALLCGAGILGLRIARSTEGIGRAPAPGRAAAGPEPARLAVAVLPLVNRTGRADLDWLSTGVAESLATDLAAGERLRVVPRDAISRTDLTSVGPVPKPALAYVRALTAADFVVSGTIEAGGPGRLAVSVLLQDAVTGETVAHLDESPAPASPQQAAARASDALRAALGVGAPSQADVVAAEAALPSNSDALRLYAEGLRLVRHFQDSAARDRFAQAAQIEPDNALLHLALSGAWERLGHEGDARQEIERALQRSAGLARPTRLLLDAREAALGGRWDEALQRYRAIWDFYPDDVSVGEEVAWAQIHSGKAKDALATVATLRALPGPAGRDPTLALREAQADEVLGRYKDERAVAARLRGVLEPYGPTPELASAWIAEGYAANRLADLPAADRAYEAARRIAESIGDLHEAAGALQNEADAKAMHGDLDGALALAHEALSLEQQLGSSHGESSLLYDIGNMLLRSGRLAEAEASMKQALAVARESNDATSIAYALNGLSVVADMRGDSSDAIEHLTELEAVASKGELTGMQLAADLNLGVDYREHGDAARARETLQRGLHLARQVGDPGAEADALTNLAILDENADDLLNAETQARDALAIARRLGDQDGLVSDAQLLGEIELEGHDLGAAERDVHEAVAAAAAVPDPNARASVQDTLAALRLAERRAGEAAVAVADGEAALGKGGDVRTRLQLAITGARVGAAQGRLAEAESALRDTAAAARAARQQDIELDARLALGRIQLQAGDHTAGDRTLQAVALAATNAGFRRVAHQAADALGGTDALP